MTVDTRIIERGGLNMAERSTNHFCPEVFNVSDPPCSRCAGRLDFRVYENYNHMDWLQWFCKANCGFYLNVQLV
jgi:hypothetical protein